MRLTSLPRETGEVAGAIAPAGGGKNVSPVHRPPPGACGADLPRSAGEGKSAVNL